MAFQLAQSYLQGQASPFDGVLEAYGQGQTLRQNRDLLQAQQAEQARKIQAQQQLETLDWSNQGDIAKVVAQFPEYTKGAKDYYDNMEATEQKAYLADSAKSMAAIDSGRPDIAVQSIRDKANAYRDMGNDAKADEMSELAEWIAKDPVSARKAIAMGYAVNAPKDAASNYKSQVDAEIAQNESPYTINEKIANADGTIATAQKTRADANETISEGLSTAAISGNAGTFSLKAGMMHAQGLITDEQKAYIDERLSDNDPEAVQTFLDGLAGQNVEIAKLNKPTTSVVNAGDQLVAIKTNADGSVEIVGSVAKGIDPTTQYNTDAATANNRYTNDTNTYNNTYRTDSAANTAANANATKQYEIEAKAFSEQQSARIKAGEAKPIVMNGYRYLLYPNGKHQLMYDQNGEAIKDNGSGGKPLTEVQANSLMYGKRMQTAGQILEGLESSTGGSWEVKGGTFMSRIFGNRANSEDGKKYEQAKRNYINAILRKESGAAIGADEFESANKQYFPQVGDTEDVIKQKAANRRQVTESMLNNAGPQGTAAKTTAVNTNKYVK